MIKVIENNDDSYTYILQDGLVQSGDNGETFTYNSSKHFIKGKGKYGTDNAIWDSDKLVSISDEDNEATLTYGNTCKKGYFPFVATMIEFGCDALFIAHPEIAGMRTTQLPASITWTHRGYGGTTSETSTMEYEFDKEGYISKIKGEEGGSASTITITWQ